MINLPAIINTEHWHLTLTQEHSADMVFSGIKWLTPSNSHLIQIGGPTNLPHCLQSTLKGLASQWFKQRPHLSKTTTKSFLDSSHFLLFIPFSISLIFINIFFYSLREVKREIENFRIFDNKSSIVFSTSEKFKIINILRK